MQGLTITEIAKKLGISYNTAKQRLFRAGVKPITKEALYEESALEKVRVVAPVGWPRKAVPTEKPVRKRKK
jgi:predicted RNA polymerase sigma factor